MIEKRILKILFLPLMILLSANLKVWCLFFTNNVLRKNSIGKTYNIAEGKILLFQKYNTKKLYFSARNYYQNLEGPF